MSLEKPHRETVAASRGERLDSWKAIAAHLGRTVRTVQRWECESGLPVHRLMHNQLSSVYAYTGDLDEWIRTREPTVSPEETEKGSAQVQSIERAQSDRVKAHEHYTRARHFMGKRTYHDIVEAIREYKKALDVEPTWALAHAGISEAYISLAGSEFKAPRECYPRARAAAVLALELQPDLAPAHAALGWVKAFFDADWSAAAAEFHAALASDPTSAVTHYWHAIMLMNLGRFADANDAILRAVDLQPLSAAMTANVSRPLIAAGRWDEALDWCRRAMDLDGDFWFVSLFAGWAHEGRAEYREARACLERSVELGGSGGVVASLAHACAKQGDRRTAEAMIRGFRERKEMYVSSVRLARVFTALGDHDEAFQWLEHACADQSIRSNAYPHYDYALEPLQSDPRFTRVLSVLNLPEGMPHWRHD